MSIWDGIRSLLAVEHLQPVQRRDQWNDYPTLQQQIATLRATGATRPWRVPSIDQALGVPAIHRAVTLISSSVGMLTMEAFRVGEALPMADAPRIVARPDPYHTPQRFYSDTAWCMATRGEFIWWIASRDGDGRPSALVVVPLREMTVEENERNRLLPKYTWNNEKRPIISTRYSPANPDGDFVHEQFPGEPFSLRGSGPLQRCGAAISVSVESQEWAANFYADGGYPSIGIKAAGEWNDAEAAAFKAQWMDAPNNVPRMWDAGVESVQEFGVNAQGAQMLEARQHQNGDAARMFGIPGSLLEYQQPGSSLTYQNLEGEFAKLVKTCLGPLYLEPIEQQMSDLLTRSTAARFNVQGFERPDAKTRAEVYNLLVPLGVMTAEQAAQAEGLAPGDIEFSPIPFAPPAAIPASVPGLRSAPESFRCDGRRVLRGRLVPCGKLLYPGTPRCTRCKKEHQAA